MNDCLNKNCSPEITCRCERCEYHSKDDKCHANGIQVGPKNAENSHETICSTFRCK